jgi:uncharacterized membrane protein YedE/YeeE
MTNLVVSFLAGLLFATGLVLSRMTRPDVVIAFLDVTGAWSPALLLVMAGSAGTFGLFYRAAVRRGRPLVDGKLHLPRATEIDARLIAGTAVFGVGWGLVGICPGPAIASLVSGASSVGLFVAAMLVGIKVADGRHGLPASTAPAESKRAEQ